MHRKPYHLDGIERIKVGRKKPPSATIKIAKKVKKGLDAIGTFFFLLAFAEKILE